MNTITPMDDLSAMKERADKLAMQKSHLQLMMNMIQKLSTVSGLENTIETLLSIIIESIGGINVTLYYLLEDEIYMIDIQYKNCKIDDISDQTVKKVFETHEFIEIEHEFKDTLLLTSEFTNAFTWVIPLIVGNKLIGVIKIDDLHITSQEFKNELPTFFNYAAIVLKNDILRTINLSNINSSLENEQKFNTELITKNNEYLALNEEYTTIIEELNITNNELIEANEKTKQSENKYRTLIENINIGIFQSTLDGKFLFANSLIVAMAGYDNVEEFINIPAQNLYVENTERDFIIKELNEKGFIKNREMHSKKKNGDIFWIAINAVILKDTNGKPISILGSIEDITDHKRIEEALFFVAQLGWQTSSENFFDALVKFLGEKLEMDYVLIDRIDKNPNMAETVALYAKGTIIPNMRYALKGTPCENVMGKRLCVYPHSIQQLFPEDTLLPEMGAESYIGIPLWNSTGQPIGLIAVMGNKPLIDEAPVTQLLQLVAIRAAAELERKQAEKEIRKLNQELETRVVERTAQLDAANKELESFSYSVSHDLRAPLRGIDGFSQVLLEEYQEQIDEQGKNYLQRIRMGAQRMAQLIDDILNLSRVSRGDMNIQEVDLSQIVHEITNVLQESQPERQVKFIIQKRIKAQGDSHLLRIVLDNLIGNAWKYTSKHPTACIEFGLQKQEDKSVYFIRDDGAGFDMNYAQKLFGAFQRLHTITEFPGTGIGLATVQRIIYRHGGSVWAESEVEKNTTFYFTIS